MIVKEIKEVSRDDVTRYEVVLQFEGEQTCLWFEIDQVNAWCFERGRIDGIIVMLLPELLLRGEDVISELPCSERLWYSLTKTVIPVLVSSSKGRLKHIEIKCPLIHTAYSHDRKSATGMSLGIDAMYTYYRHLEGCPPNFEVELLCYFNHGAHNDGYTKNSIQMRESYEEGRRVVSEFAALERRSFLACDTNLDEILPINYTNTHTFRTAGIALLFQKEISNYFYSSGFGMDDFSINPFDDSAMPLKAEYAKISYIPFE